MLEPLLKKPSTTTVIISSITSFIIGVIATLLLYFGWPQTEPELVHSPQKREEVCSHLSGPDFSTCCDSWARSNDILTPQCVGSWVKLGGQCSWSCDAGI